MSHDARLQKAVLAELNWDPSVPAGHIGVTANNGVVTLSGTPAAMRRNTPPNGPRGASTA